MSRWIDITCPIGDRMICWPGRQPPRRVWEKRLADGDHCNVCRWDLNAHTGTHIDAPLHFVDGGASIDQIAVDVLIGPCRVVTHDEDSTAPLDRASVEPYRGVQRLLVRTRHPQAAVDPTMTAYVHHDALLTEDAVALLLDHGLLMLGTDRLSVDDSRSADFTIHHLILGKGVVIVEGLALSRIGPGDYELCALPLRLEGGEASPARVLARSI